MKDNIVYVAGRVMNVQIGEWYAVQWVNGIKTQLTSSAIPSNANAIALNGNDIYIAGNYLTHNGTSVAVYWKNGIEHKLVADTTLNSYAFGIAINDGHVYIVGNVVAVPGAEWQATLWKDGVIAFTGQGVPPGYSYSSAYAVAVNGSDIYLAGDLNENSVPVYWKNGVMIQIGQGPATTINAIAVNGQDVYLSGFETAQNADNQFTVTPMLWKNGTATQLSTPLANMEAGSGIAVNGSDVYVTGGGGYWKNGSLVQVPGQSPFVFGIAVVPQEP